jgi:hypothetical protein
MKRKISNINRQRLGGWPSISADLLSKISEREIFVNLGDSSAVLLESDCIKAVSEMIPESATRNLLLKCLVDAESRSPGSSIILLSKLAGSEIQNNQKGCKFNVDTIHSSLSTIIGRESADICVRATRIAGRKGKILLDSAFSTTSEICYGTQVCSWKPDQSFFISLGQSRASIQDCKVIFIDGIIESVSECHRLFQESYERKVPIAIFARGYAEEVYATAAVNMQRQTAQIIPILIPFDEVGVNGMGDLASCFGAELISSDKGQLISNVSLEDCVSASRLSCSEAGTEIEQLSGKTDEVVLKLTKKLESADASQSDLIRRRLKALGSSLVTIKIGNDKKSLAGLQRDRVDFGLRYIRKCMRDGVVKFNDFYLPASSIDTGLDCARSFSSIVENCGAVLEVDRCG